MMMNYYYYLLYDNKEKEEKKRKTTEKKRREKEGLWSGRRGDRERRGREKDFYRPPRCTST